MVKIALNPGVPLGGGPFIIVPPAWDPGDNQGQLLTAAERARLAAMSTITRFKRGQTICRAGDQANFVFNIVAGVIKSYRTLADRKQHIIEFIFAGDLLFLAKEDKFLNSAEAVTAVTLYKIPRRLLEVHLHWQPRLSRLLTTKLVYELYESQNRAVLLRQRYAAAKISLFIQKLEARQAQCGIKRGEVYLPMNRADIASYVGISSEAVSRSFRELVSGGAITFRDRRHVKIVDRARLESVIWRSRAARGGAHSPTDRC